MGILSTIILYSQLFNIDPNLAISIAKVESRLDNNAVGALGEIGLFQIRPEYVSISKKLLKNPIDNTLTALQILSEVRKSCKHKVQNTWIVCYNRGVAGGAKLKNPIKDNYYKKVMREYSKTNSKYCLKYGAIDEYKTSSNK